MLEPLQHSNHSTNQTRKRPSKQTTKFNSSQLCHYRVGKPKPTLETESETGLRLADYFEELISSTTNEAPYAGALNAATNKKKRQKQEQTTRQTDKPRNHASENVDEVDPILDGCCHPIIDTSIDSITRLVRRKHGCAR